MMNASSSNAEPPSSATSPLIPMTYYMVNQLKNKLLKTYDDIQYHDQETSCMGMTITRSQNQPQIFISQKGLAQRIISDFQPDDFHSATSSASSHLFNQIPENKPSTTE